MEIIIKKTIHSPFRLSILVVGIIEEATVKRTELNLSDILMGPVSEVCAGALGIFKGKKDEFSLLYTSGLVPFSRLMLVGLGKKKDHTVEMIRSITGTISRRIRDIDIGSVGVILDHFTI